MRTLGVVLAVVVAVGCGGGGREARTRHPIESGKAPLRVKMEDLHMMGGVPARWKFTPPPGDPAVGKALFVDYGCHTCHRVEGENFSAGGGGAQVGPDLTGMGAHHPAGYFAEAIMNPNAIVLEGPGYAGPDGRSVMPSYDSMTVAEVADLVAYIQSLNTGEAAHSHDEHIAMGHMQPMAPLVPPQLPQPPAAARGAYITMVYDVLPGKLEPFTQWFSGEGKAMLEKIPGVVSQETFVDVTRDASGIVTSLRFKDSASLQEFMNNGDPTFGEKWDSFIGPHGHFVYVFPPIYRVPALSSEP